jgi:multicomponent Na+:H+ antiporter subunit G
MRGLLGLAALYLGLLITTVGVIGIYRFPDVYTRLNALAKVTTLGALLIHLSSAALLAAGHGTKGVLTAVVLLLTTPVVTHAIGLMAHTMKTANVNQRDELREAREGRQP